MRFDELVQAPVLRKAVEEIGWSRPTPIQERAIPLVRKGGDLVGIAQTGTGKTGAFLLPTLEKQIGRSGLHTLVLCPTRELAQQVAADARELAHYAGLVVGEIVGGLPMRPQIQGFKAGYDVVVATPGRLLDHVERGHADLSNVETLILDEADRMLDMGFRPQIEAILRNVPRDRQTLLFSATMPNGVHALALRIMRSPEWIEAAPSATTADGIDQRLYPVRAERKPALLLELLASEQWTQVLVFSATKVGADVLMARLQHAKVNAAIMHGDRDMRQRRAALEAFAEGRVRVLIATDVAQRGLDIEGISHVVNFDVPRDPEAYVHRIGRTGRAGATGSAVTFMTAGELPAVRGIERLLGAPIPRISLPEYDYDPHPMVDASTTKARVSRSGGRMGTRKVDELSPEQLKELLRVG